MLTVGLFLVSGILVGLGQEYVVEKYKDNMLNSAEEVAHTASSMAYEESLSSWLLGITISSVSKATGNHIFISDTQGKIVCCSDSFPVCEHLGMTVPETVLAVLREESGYEAKTNLDGIYQMERLVMAVPVKDSEGALENALEKAEKPETADTVLGYVFVSVCSDDIFNGWKPFFLFMLVTSLVVLCAMLFFAFQYSKRMSRPLDEIAEASRMFARGDFSVRVSQPDDTTDEMGALIDSFNKMADSLQNAEKRRSEFVSNISHELRTPMTTIAGFADGILDGTIPKEQEAKYLLSIRDETRRLSRLVRNMLDVSKMNATAADPTRRSVFELTELVLQILLSFESRANEKKLDVDPQLPDNGIMVRADRDGITQVIYNLLDNAVKFASVGSCITLRVYRDHEKAYVSVKDRGETIPPDDLPYIFDRFHKSDRSRSLDKDGVGLGLYLVKTIINGHDEDIAVKSENGVTEFVFTLPIAE